MGEQTGGKVTKKFEHRGQDRRKNPEGTPPPGMVVDRRLGLDPREVEKLAESTGLERRRGRGRRLSAFSKAAEEGEMTPEQFLFLMAIDEFKKVNDKPFPTWTDVLEVVRLLGYRKTAASELKLTCAEDWTEPGDNPSDVRPDNWHDRPLDPSGKMKNSRLMAEHDELSHYDFDLDDLSDEDAEEAA